MQLTWVLALLTATVITHRRGNEALNERLGHLLAGGITFFLVWSLVLLVRALTEHKESPATFLRSAVVLWITNVLVFAYWYWHLDGGGSPGRDWRNQWRAGLSARDFLFPQMSFELEATAWTPKFIDYLFVAFNTSMAFSPTDVPVLSRKAKMLTMLQSSVSLIVVVVLAARAVGMF